MASYIVVTPDIIRIENGGNEVCLTKGNSVELDETNSFVKGLEAMGKIVKDTVKKEVKPSKSE